jgi:MoaA/NifB/PqqE/SkfB family radical SAM enzyme
MIQSNIVRLLSHIPQERLAVLRLKSLIEFLPRMLGTGTPRWQYLQVEVTTRCNLPGCLMCPRSAWPGRWQNQDLDWASFEALIPDLKRVTQVHLSGWGEPLLHPQLWDMAKMARSQRCAVSLTTNGLGLNEEVQLKVLDHLDMIAISLDGARAATYERLRPGADFARVTRQIAELCARKRSMGRRLPEVALLFMKMRPNLAELPEFLGLAADLGVDRVNATNLDFVPTAAIADLSLISPGGPAPEIEAVLQEAALRAQKVHMHFRNLSLKPKADLVVCDANPLQNAFVTASGEVAPCVYLGLPLAGDFTRHFFEGSYPASNISFGNIRDCLLSTLWRQRPYLKFTNYFLQRQDAAFSLLQILAGDYQTSGGQEGAKRSASFRQTRYIWPPACRGCYKTLGF